MLLPLLLNSYNISFLVSLILLSKLSSSLLFFICLHSIEKDNADDEMFCFSPSTTVAATSFKAFKSYHTHITLTHTCIDTNRMFHFHSKYPVYPCIHSSECMSLNVIKYIANVQVSVSTKQHLPKCACWVFLSQSHKHQQNKSSLLQ